jgi:hypothetical protein
MVVHDWQQAYLWQSNSLRAISFPFGLELGRDFCPGLRLIFTAGPFACARAFRLFKLIPVDVGRWEVDK